ncbi:MAG TPA: SBBP repeat-containing protein [Pyrinomonadaceae bacterium]|nr:SBBP repeat-containing protein [Pyrinomonadaceae bacterium]
MNNKSLSLLILLALGLAAVFAPKSTGVSVEWPNIPHTQSTEAARHDFGRLPLSFEVNQGQADARVKFLARGQGYGIFLTGNGAAFSLNGSALHMHYKDAATAPRITGVDQLPGKVNYLAGNKSSEWRTNIPTYERVRYEQIYPGIDLVYYGNQRQLEYDFVIAPGASFKQIRLAFDGADKLKLNRSGDLILKSGAQAITLLRPKAYQNIDNKKREISVRYSLKRRGEVTFKVGNYDKSQPLVIDPLLVYSTFLGGSGQDTGNGVAVDSSGNVYIAGQTVSPNFPTTVPLLAPYGGNADAFVAKLNANGSALIYSTFLGGNLNDIATSIAVDNAGNAYVTGETNSGNFPVFNALHPTLSGNPSDAFVAELNSTGSALVYSTYLGGHSDDSGNAIAVDNAGNAYITGNTLSRDFPTTNPVRANRSGHAIFKSMDAAVNWGPSDSGLAASLIIDLVFQPGNSSIVYAATDTGLFKSTDSGAHWIPLPGSPPFIYSELAIDPVNPAIIYVATNGGVFKSTDGGNNFTLSNTGIDTHVRSIAVDPVTPTILYAAIGGGPYFKSVNGGASWTQNLINGASRVDSITIDPNTPTTLFADTDSGIFRSTDSGANWTELNTGIADFHSVNSITIDPVNNIIYAATTSGIRKSTNGGNTWTHVSGNTPFDFLSVAFDPTNPAVFYGATAIQIRKTIDGGNTWNDSDNGFSRTRISALIANPTQPSTLFVGTTSTSDVFVTKLSAGGTSQIYSTYLGGDLLDLGNAIAVDPSGNAYVTGVTNSVNFPTANALQGNRGDNFPAGDAFVTKLNPSGSALVYSTYLGADFNDAGRAIAADTNGNAYVCGTTGSQSFPTVNAFQPHKASLSSDAFVTKINAAGSALIYSTYLGGDNSDDCAGLAIDAAGSAYITGDTNSPDFPTLAPMQPALNGGFHDVFITRLAPNGSSLINSTYLGGTNHDFGRGIALDSSQNIYVVGTTSSTDFPTHNPLQPGFGGGSDVFIAKLRPAPEIVVTMSDSPDPVSLGSNLTYTITVNNIGELPATGVTLTDKLPAGATLVSANSTAGTCTGTTTITCGLGTLNAGATVTVTIVVTPPEGTITNTATVTLNEADAPANNTATAETLVDSVDLSITKKAAQDLVAPGSTLTFSLLVKNKSAAPADVIVADNLPAGLTLTKCVATGNGVCGANGSVTFSKLAGGASETVLLTVAVSASATEGTVISNTATVSSPVLDPDTSNNSSTASVTVAALPILQKSNGLIAFERSFFSLVQEPSGIYTAKADLTDVKLFNGIAANSGAGKPEWSPDGSRLAFQKNTFINDGANEIFVINADGSGLLKVTDKAWFNNRGITWSPNGSQIAFISDDGPQSIHIANADGSGSYGLPGSPTSLFAVDWSPGGTKFVYSNGKEIFVINTDGTGKQQLTTVQQTPNGETSDTDPRWSPDGTKILFTRYVNGVFGFTHVMNADGSNQRKLFNFDSYTPYWSPDGQSITMMISPGRICTVNFDNTNLNCPNNDNSGFFDITPSWQRLPNPNPTPTPAPVPTFSLSGKVIFDTEFVFATVELSGPVKAQLITGVNGNYEFVNLPAGQYTLKPINKAYDFNPPSRTVTITNANITGLDFVATFVPFSISGHVKDNNGNPLVGFRVFIGQQGSQSSPVLTDQNGFYAFTKLGRGGTYFVNPESGTVYDFVPASKVFENLARNEVLDFVGTKQPANVISGRVIEAVTGVELTGIRVDLSSNSGNASTFTEAHGIFSFGERRSNIGYQITVPDDSTFIFEPKINAQSPFAQISIPSLTSDQFLTFTATRKNVVKFASAAPRVSEGSGAAEIVVTREGDIAGPATVNFETADTAGLQACSVVNGIASERCDYGSTAGTLRFAAGEASKSIVIPLVDDVKVEAEETFRITLTTAVGAQRELPAVRFVTIVDNDVSPVSNNPIDGIEPFVTQQYIDFLGRLPDPVGFANWVATLSGCPQGGFGENLNPSCDRVHVSSGFFLSDEFRGRGYFVYRFYEVAFDRRPRYAEFVPDMVQVGGAQSPESESLSKAAYIVAFVNRPEFTNRYNALSNADYVNALEQNAEITLSNKTALIAALDSGQETRAHLLSAIVQSKAVEDKFFIRAFVAMQYFGYLRRDPDPVGFNNWVTTLNNDPSNFRHMIFGFLFSDEYRGRFGP